MRAGDIAPGFRVGKLVAVEKAVRTLTSGRRMPAWVLRCDCGKSVIAMTVNITKDKHRSCGCAQKEAFAARLEAKRAARLNRPPRTNPEAVSRRPEYRIYRQMLDRCYLRSAANYPWYGAKGVTVCDRWRCGEGNMTGFECFYQDMGPRPEGLTLDRIDPRLGYEGSNCRWATWAQQGKNRRFHHMSGKDRADYVHRIWNRFRGENSPVAKLTNAQVARMKTLMSQGARTGDLAKAFGVSPQTVSGIRVGRKWTHVSAA